jgi:type II secretory pathway predicted ATPase ExeA
MNKKLLAAYGLKWNPFATEVPAETLKLTPKIDHFIWRMENQIKEGGFALVTGEPGSGKSVALRMLSERLRALRDVSVGVMLRPQCGAADFYRELGHLFGVSLTPNNRWAGSRALREKWLTHIDAALFRPVLIIDEAQQMQPAVLSELRLLSSVDFDSRSLLTVILCGDGRLTEKLSSSELAPVQSRIRVRLCMEHTPPPQLAECLQHALEQAGNHKLMTAEVIGCVAEQAGGNFRTMMTMANDLLASAIRNEQKQIDEKLYLELFSLPASRLNERGQKPKAAVAQTRGR